MHSIEITRTNLNGERETTVYQYEYTPKCVAALPLDVAQQVIAKHEKIHLEAGSFLLWRAELCLGRNAQFERVPALDCDGLDAWKTDTGKTCPACEGEGECEKCEGEGTLDRETLIFYVNEHMTIVKKGEAA